MSVSFRDIAGLLVAVAIPLAVGYISSMASEPVAQTWYQILNKPPWAPPAWIFGPVWTALYILMGGAAWSIWRLGIDRSDVQFLYWYRIWYEASIEVPRTEKADPVSKAEARRRMETNEPGLVALFGSGETSHSGRKVCEWIMNRLEPPISVSILETPAGFQPNSAQVAGKVAAFLMDRLQNYRPDVSIIPARKKGTPFSTDAPDLLAPLLHSKVIFLGPGSPTYAAKQLQGSLAWEYVQARHRLGSALLLASAATIAVGSYALPVYEIYKVGCELHWQPGLDFFRPYGLSLVFIPHWNNREGGAELDTSRAYMGQKRFGQLLQLLPSGVTTVGIDEHTALVMDLGSERCQVMGRGGVTLLKGGDEIYFASGEIFPISQLGPFRKPMSAQEIHPESWSTVLSAEQETKLESADPPREVLTQMKAREEARARRDWETADHLREAIAKQGWRVLDTPEGPRLERIAGSS